MVFWGTVSPKSPDLVIIRRVFSSANQTMWSYDSRQLAVARRSLDMVDPNPIHGRLLVLV